MTMHCSLCHTILFNTMFCKHQAADIVSLFNSFRLICVHRAHSFKGDTPEDVILSILSLEQC